MTRARPILLAVALAALPLAGGPAGAAPRVSIRARTAITLDPVRRTEGGLLVSGHLIERGSGEPVPRATVEIDIDGRSWTVATGPEGTFVAELPSTSGQHDLRIEYPGGGSFDASSAELPRLDVAKRPVTLLLEAPDRHSRQHGALTLSLNAHDDSGPVAVPVEVRLGDSAADSLPVLARVETLASGPVQVTLAPAQLGPPGRKRIEVSFPGDAVFDPAQITDTLLLTSATTLSAALDDDRIGFEGHLVGHGRLTDDAGAPVAAQAVTLVVSGRGGADRRSLDEAVTGPDGGFTVEAPAGELGGGPHTVQVVFTSTRPYLESSRSAPVRIEVAPRRPVPVGYSLAAFAATFAAILAFVLLRTRPWTRWLGRLRREAPGPAAGSARSSEATPHTGLALARPSLVSTLRRPHDHGFSGHVADAVTGRPVAGARVALRVAAQGGGAEAPAERAAVTDASGRFTFEDLPPGTHHAQVGGAGYVSERFSLSVPHRGELSGARIDLLPVRERIFSLYREVAGPLLPRRELWGVWTPRQIVDHVRGARPAPVLASLTDYVEEKYFSGRTPDEDEIPSAAERVRLAVAESATAQAIPAPAPGLPDGAQARGPAVDRQPGSGYSPGP